MTTDGMLALHTLRRGVPGSLPLVVLHGFPVDHRMWLDVTDLLPGERTVIARAAVRISRRGAVMPWAITCTAKIDTTIASGNVRDGPRWLRRPIHVMAVARATDAMTRTPSLILIEEKRSRGRTSGRRPRPCRGVLISLRSARTRSRRRGRCG